jgi:uridine phosphorylase
MEAVRNERSLAMVRVPSICVLDFDGDLADGLLREGAATFSESWACFHTQMLVTRAGDVECGVIPRTIGGPYAVLIAEQLRAAGAQLTIGLTSAGRIAPSLPLPSIVVIEEAIRDEGTSLHYLPPSRTVTTPTPSVVDDLVQHLTGVSSVRRGLAWTTDAPYRETNQQLRGWRAAGVLAVEMQAASLFAFAHARRAAVAVVALVSNSVDADKPFDTGGHSYRAQLLSSIVNAGQQFLARSNESGERRPRA